MYSVVVWEQATHAVLAAVKELGLDIDQVSERAKLILHGNEVYRFVEHPEVSEAVNAIFQATEEVRKTNKPKS